MNILLVEDEVKLSAFVAKGLESEGFHVTAVYNGQEGSDLFNNETFDVAILDLMLPGKNGLDILRDGRAANVKTPVLILTAKDSLETKMEGFTAGTDDYMTKPFHFEELLARLNALLRRSAQAPPAELKIADLVLNLHTHTATRAGQNIELTAKEFSLLEFFLHNPDVALNRTTLCENAWKEFFDRNTNLIDVYVMYLRKKIDENFEPKLIHTVRGIGYLFGVRG